MAEEAAPLHEDAICADLIARINYLAKEHHIQQQAIFSPDTACKLDILFEWLFAENGPWAGRKLEFERAVLAYMVTKFEAVGEEARKARLLAGIPPDIMQRMKNGENGIHLP